MLAVAIIAFREFLEAFLLIGLFIGINRKLQLHKHKEIYCATIIGLTISLLLPLIVFFFANDLQAVLVEKNIDKLEGYLLVFSGFFVAYVVYALHDSLKQFNKDVIATAHRKMEQKIFDLSLFLMIIFFIAREGFEIALLVATTSLFSTLAINIFGLAVGFFAAFGVGFSASLAYKKLPIKKIFTYTEYTILIIGAALVKNGASLLLKNYFAIHLEKFLPLPLSFLPSEKTVFGHLLASLFGIQRELSIVQVCIMGIYIVTMYLVFIKRIFAKTEE